MKKKKKRKEIIRNTGKFRTYAKSNCNARSNEPAFKKN